MKIGCFALIEPFTSMQRQFEAVAEMGIEYADVTDTHDGASLGVEAGFTPSTSLDSHPEDVRRMAEDAGLTLSTFCAHASLLDPAAPSRYGTSELVKAIRLANLLGIEHVITTEGEANTQFARNLDPEQRRLVIREKLQTPIRWAEELDVSLLLETHGPVTDDPAEMEALLKELGHEDTIGICLDTGNSWLGGADPIDYIERFGPRIKHVHWKDLEPEWEEKRGSIYGIGMATIPLGDGIVDVHSVVSALDDAGFEGCTTLELAGKDNIQTSVERLRGWSKS